MRNLILPIIVVGIVLTIVYSVFYYQTEETATITVIGKERIVESTGESTTSKWIVKTETEVFENTDDLVYLKFNSADFDRWLVEDSTYTVTVIGWRVPVFSMYRNIVEIKR